MKTGLLLIGFLMFFAATDTYVQDYAKIVAAYSSKKSLSFNVAYKSFDTSKQVPDTVLVGKYRLEGDNFYVKVAGTESIRNRQYYLSIDHAHMLMFLAKASAFSGNFFPTSSIDTLLKRKGVKIASEDLSNGAVRRYTLTPTTSNNAYKSWSFEYSLTSFLITKVVMKLTARENVYEQANWPYITDPFIEMVYSDYSFNDIDDNLFSVQKFLEVKSETDIKLKEAYKNYELINTISLRQQIK
jgi:hypothetical protein